MKRPRAILCALAALAFAGIVLSAGCTDLPPIPDPQEHRVERATGRFIVYGDTRRGMPFEGVLRATQFDRERQAVAARLLVEKPDFVLHSGDLVGRGSSGAQWRDEWDAAMRPLVDAKVPLFMAWGNHEYFADPGEAARHIHSRFPHLNGEHWYGIRYDRVLIAVLDSNFEELRDADSANCARQEAWLARAIAAAQADDTVGVVLLVFHHAPYTNSSVHNPNEEAQKAFLERGKRSTKVRASITGHVHNYERFLIDGTHHVVAGGGGAPKTKVNVASPRFKDQFEGPETRPFQYCLFTVEPKRIVVDVMMLKDDGSWYRGDGFTIE